MKPAILIYFAICIYSCAAPTNKEPLIAKDSTNEIERNNKLFVFVGEKIEVKHEPDTGSYTLDNKFTAWYKVLQRVYGKYDNDYIEFKVYDHYGWPPFAKYQHALLFVSEDSGKYYLEKYMSYDVYKTKSGRWAGGYAIHDYTYHNITKVKPEIIDFKNEVSYPTKEVYDDGTVEEIYYPEPYYKIEGNKAIAIYGNYIEDLFRIKKEGPLSDLFVPTPPVGPIDIKDVVLGRFTPAAEEKKFMNFWEKTFLPIIKSGNLQQFKNWSLTRITLCDSICPIEAFDEACFQKIFTKEYILTLNSDVTSFSSYESTNNPIATTILNGHTIAKKKKHIVYSMTLGDTPKYIRAFSFTLEFVETDKGYVLTGINNDRYNKCCQ